MTRAVSGTASFAPWCCFWADSYRNQQAGSLSR